MLENTFNSKQDFSISMGTHNSESKCDTSHWIFSQADFIFTANNCEKSQNQENNLWDDILSDKFNSGVEFLCADICHEFKKDALLDDFLPDSIFFSKPLNHFDKFVDYLNDNTINELMYDSLYQILPRPTDVIEVIDVIDQKNDVLDDFSPDCIFFNPQIRQKMSSCLSFDSNIFEDTNMGSKLEDIIKSTIKSTFEDIQKNKKYFTNLPKIAIELLTSNLTNQIIVLIDYENISNEETNKFKKSIKIMRDKNINVQMLTFAGYNNPRSNTADVIVESKRKDAVDHFISYYVGMLEMKSQSPNKIHVITMDHFGQCLQDICDTVIHNSCEKNFTKMYI